MTLRRPVPIAVVLAPLPVVAFAAVHAIVVTPPDVVSTLLHAILGALGAGAGYAAGTLGGLLRPPRRTIAPARWLATGTVAVVTTLAGTWIGRRASLDALGAAPSTTDLPGLGDVWAALVAVPLPAIPLGVWAAAFAATWPTPETRGD